MRNAALLLFLAGPASAAVNLVQEPGVRVASGVLAGFAATAPADRYYLIHESTAVYSYTTPAAAANTGEAFNQDANDSGVRLSTFTEPRLDVSSITGLTIAPLDPTGFRMLYSAVGSTGTLFRIYSATSADGYAWANDTGTIVTGAVPVGSPSVVELATGDWRLFYIQNGLIFTALSTNEGRNFSGHTQLLANSADGVSAVRRTDDLIRVYFTSGTVVYSALSTNNLGSTFNVESGIRFSTIAALGTLNHPFVQRAATETWRWRMYYNFGDASTSISTRTIYSASTHGSEITSVDPNSVLRKDEIRTFTVTGEGFGNSHDGVVTLPAASANGTAGAAITRPNDLTVTFDLNILLSLGFYNVTITNPNGQTSTLNSAFLVDAPGGSLTTLDNVFRPRQGGRARVDATVYFPGHLVIRLYTITGEPIATLFDGIAQEGTTSVFWDGRTAGGGTVASGLYIVHAVGPKLNMSNKIVVIK